MPAETFTREQVIRLLELAAAEGMGTAWGSGAVAEKVMARYEGEDGTVKNYVDTGDGFDEALAVL